MSRSRTSRIRTSCLVGALLAVACSGEPNRSPFEESADAGSGPLVAAPPRAITLAESATQHHAALDALLRPGARGFVESGGRLSAKGPARNDLGAELATLANGPLEVSLGGSSSVRLSLTLLDARPAPAVVHAGRAVFEDVYPSSDRIVVAHPARIEELLVLRDAHAPTELTWRLELGSDLPLVQAEPSGAITFSSADGEPQLRIPAPYLVDASGTTRAASAKLVDGYYHVSFDAAGLAYPVVLDPGVETAIWQDVTPASPPPARSFSPLAYDSTNQVTVLFGGYTMPGGTYVSDTWEWNGSLWSTTCATGACGVGARRAHVLAFDSARTRTVMFGGRDSINTALDDTWEYNAASNVWAQGCGGSGCATKPSARQGACMAFDSQNAVSVLFSGLGAINDTWSYNGTAWNPICNAGACLTTSPPARRFAAMAYDSVRHVVVLFGGQDNATSNYLSDTWELSGSTWSKRCNDGACGPAPRSNFSMAFDTRSKRVVLFGGVDASASSRSDTWEWNGTTWTDPYPGTSTPPGRYNHGTAYDAARRRVVMYGGLPTADTWTYHSRGGGCSTAADCDTNLCVDGVCCTTTCGGTCQRCDSPGANLGLCVAVMNAQDPDTCTGTSSCDGSGACKKALGQVCSAGSECASTFCRDGRCCANDCSTACRSCANAAGTCTSVVASQDDDNCNGTSTCSASGVCLKDNGQGCTLATECASNFCTDGTCCVQACSGSCLSCANATGSCNAVTNQEDVGTCSGASSCDASGTCKKKAGQSCTLGTECVSGSCQDSTCCTDTCTTPCRSCANASGTCTTLVTSTTDNYCGAPNSCDASGTCKKALGQSCSAGTDCASGTCKDSTCCSSACTGSCASCANASGTCQNVLNADDSDTCAGTNTCDGTATCKKKNGQSCAGGTECASGNCKDGTCCNSVCTGACQTCANSSGTCLSVTSADDSDTCSGTSTCDASGACKKKNGQGCSAVGECASGICKDNTCCGSACTGTCQTCANSSGACQTVTGASDPDTCASPNACDATGLCKLQNGQSCSSGSQCVGGNCVDGFCCNTACAGGCDVCAASLGAPQDGTCTVLGSGSAGGCGAYLCGGNATCPSTCSSDNNCAGGYYCSGNQCVAKKAKGTACSASNECGSTAPYCADGVCCNTTCTGKCMACDAANKQTGTDGGTCDAAKQGTNPGNQCVLSSDPCGEQASCSGSPGTCSMGAFGKSCGPTSCTGSAVSGKVCDGTGTCIDQTNVQCSPYVCKAGACSTPCGADSDCINGYYCSGTTCVQKSDNGKGCNTASECKSGFCADGVCCDVPCQGQCQACAQTGSVGQCTTVSGTPVAPRPDCAGSGTCKGTCALANPNACTYPAAGTDCAAASCVGDVAQPAASCDGAGLCAVPSTVGCVPYACDASQGTCKATCATNADCSQGATCDTSTGKCAATSAICKDAYTISLPNGQTQSCVPYKCVGGACQQQCSGAGECAPGYTCQGKACVADEGGTDAGSGGTGASGGSGGSSATGGSANAPGTGGKDAASSNGDDGGCGCRVPARGSGPTLPWLVAGLLAALALGRRPARQPSARRASSCLR